jgi:hypothetical protein
LARVLEDSLGHSLVPGKEFFGASSVKVAERRLGVAGNDDKAAA